MSFNTSVPVLSKLSAMELLKSFQHQSDVPSGAMDAARNIVGSENRTTRLGGFVSYGRIKGDF